MTHFGTALAIATAYLAFVFFGSVSPRLPTPAATNSRAARLRGLRRRQRPRRIALAACQHHPRVTPLTSPTPLTSLTHSQAVMRTQKSGFAEALYPVRFAYNVAQMMLCSYMAIEAAIVAYREVTFQDTMAPAPACACVPACGLERGAGGARRRRAGAIGPRLAPHAATPHPPHATTLGHL